MRLSSEMKNLSEELLNSFKQRIKENEELVNEVQKTLNGFHKDRMEMAATLNADAMALRNNLASGEKERMGTYNELMSQVHHTISSIQNEVMGIQTSTFNMINEFATDRTKMAADLNKFFTESRTDMQENEKIRLKEFDTLMKNINDDIKSINEEVTSIFKNTNNMLAKFESEHLGMSVELSAKLGKNLAERVEYTRKLLGGFQKRLQEISKENQKMANELRKDLNAGEAERLNDYKEIMKGIHKSINGIRIEVKGIQKAMNKMLEDLSDERVQASAEWNKMEETMAQIRKTGIAKPPKEAVRKAEKKIEVKVEIPVEVEKKILMEEKPIAITAPEETKTLDKRILDYINKHPKGVKISEMEEPLGETRMKLGFIAKALLDEGKVQKMDNIYFPIK